MPVFQPLGCGYIFMLHVRHATSDEVTEYDRYKDNLFHDCRVVYMTIDKVQTFHGYLLKNGEGLFIVLRPSHGSAPLRLRLFYDCSVALSMACQNDK